MLSALPREALCHPSLRGWLTMGIECVEKYTQNLQSIEGVPTEMLSPWKTWADEKEYKTTLNNLTGMFQV